MRSILFVDDEVGLLEGLSSRLYQHRNEWHMEYAGSAAEALAFIGGQHFDVIVTDLRMPGMDGCALLEQVAEKCPDAARIVLSGYATEEQSAHVVPLAHQYLSKPCEPARLESVIDRCLKLKDQLAEPALRGLIGRIRTLPSPPLAYQRIIECMSSSSANIRDVARIVESDVALSAKVLQVANSAFFRIPRKVTRIEQAVVHLGFGAIRTLALSSSLFGKPLSRSVLDIERVQQQSHRMAAAAEALADTPPERDDAFLAGMLHECGTLILAQACPQDLERARDLSAREGLIEARAQERILGASHAEVGAYLLGLWGLPYPIIEAVAHHHRPDRIGNDATVAIRVAAAQVLLDEYSVRADAARELDGIALGLLSKLRPVLTVELARERIAVLMRDEAS
jgi:HD-like signal output (HDOD) protein